MILKKIFLICIVVLLASCGAKKKAVNTSSEETTKYTLPEPKESAVIAYESLGNGVASIGLQFFKNNTFQFDFKSIPQPESDDKPLNITERGSYTSEGTWKILKFRKIKFSLESVFDPSFSNGNDFKVLDENTVKVNTANKVLAIWGVACEKQ